MRRAVMAKSIQTRCSPNGTGRNRTGPPCSVGRPTAHAPGGSVTDDDRRQPQYWPIRRASINMLYIDSLGERSDRPASIFQTIPHSYNDLREVGVQNIGSPIHLSTTCRPMTHASQAIHIGPTCMTVSSVLVGPPTIQKLPI